MSNYYTHFRNSHKFINITNLKDSNDNSKLYNINQKALFTNIFNR